jgi:uncharacterized protein
MFKRMPLRKAFGLALLVVSAAFGLDTSKLKPTGYVNDFAHAIDPGSTQHLENYAGNLERATGVQIAIVTVDTLEDEPIDDVANRLYRQWGIGKKGKDEGILLLLAIKDHKQRAEIGYGLEPIIPDGYAGGVLRGIRPILRQGNYGGALLAAVQEFGQKIATEKGVELPDEVGRRMVQPQGRQVGIPWPVLIGGFFLLLWIIGRFSGGGGGSGVGGLLAGMFLGNMMGRGGSGWGGGGFGGGGSGGGGGFGGFGGGDSGGGGASSDW